VPHTLAERISQSRKKAGYSQRKLAELLEVTHVTVQKWEGGQHTPGSIDLGKIADLFGVSTDWLLGRETSSSYNACKEHLLTEKDQARLAEIISLASLQIRKANDPNFMAFPN
jgi:transcriptional regulator with XRE-family HTH domain